MITHDLVQECAVFGVPVDDDGDQIVAYVALAKGAGVSQDEAQQQLEYYLGK